MNVESKYRRKLKDLVSAVDAFAQSLDAVSLATVKTNESFKSLIEETDIIKQQLAIEERYNAQMPSHGVTQ